MKRLFRILIWTHRYLGIVLSAFFLMWFLTGIGMIYARGMPRLTPEVRLSRLPALDFSRIHLSPAEAARETGTVSPRRATLTTILDRPVYQFSGRGSRSVFADTGALVTEISPSDAKLIAARFMDVDGNRLPDPIVVTEPDQWTLQARFPLYKFAVGDDDGTELYVSTHSAEVVQLSTRFSRRLAWVSAIPHFLYFRSLRLNTEAWNSTVVWLSAFGCLLALVGVVIGVMHIRPAKPSRIWQVSAWMPYRGMMRWHYGLGLVFGLLTLTWVFSGLLSMEPWDWTTKDNSLEQATASAFPAGPGDLTAFPSIDADRWRSALGGAQVKEIEFVSIMDEPHYIVRSASGLPPVPGPPDGGHQPYFVMRGVDPQRWVIAANGFNVRSDSFAAKDIVQRLQSVLPDTAASTPDLLPEYDSYYYSRDGYAPLPVLRIKMADADSTWLYIDPQVSQVVGRVNRINRAERWLYNGLHTLDFPFLYYNRPLWDAVVITLSLGGAGLSGIGLLLGLRRVARGMKKALTAFRKQDVGGDEIQARL